MKETLEHCEEVPADRGLMENFRDLVVSLETWHLKARCHSDAQGKSAILCRQESQQRRDLAEQNYSNYKEVIWKLQHQLDESRRKIQEYQVHEDICERDAFKGWPSQQ